jgi:hypothetical protein
VRVGVSKDDAERFALGAVLAAVGASQITPGAGTVAQGVGAACITVAAVLVLVDIVRSIRRDLESTAAVPLRDLPLWCSPKVKTLSEAEIPGS